ncbi:MAG: DNA-3-methyladenine glycosylase 2 family protein, partial [Chitinophagales bacterium]|nr:DNA-3-methyladenine glycosylase 2 family protein [Chitinophagales bacterium]
FDLETDIKPFYEMALKDELLKPLVKKYFGYRIVGIVDLFESLCWAIIGQQINLNFAYMLKQRFIMQFGERLLWNGKTYYLFPKIKKIAALEINSLLSLQFSKQKANYIIDVARAFESGNLSQHQIAGLSFEDAKETLLKLKGIGNWTANYVLMKTFHHPNAFPLEDAGLEQAIRRNLNLIEKPALQMIENIFKKYEGWEAYGTLYLWRSLSDL